MGPPMVRRRIPGPREVASAGRPRSGAWKPSTVRRTTMAQLSRTGEPRRRPRLSATLLLFLITSAAGPLASVVGTVPLGFAQAGPGLPVAYLGAMLILLCFAVGYAAISRRVVSTGAFYTYIARGIGRPPAIGA